MKKLLTLTTVCTLCALITDGAYALVAVSDPCADMGLSVMAACTKYTTGTNGNYPLIVDGTCSSSSDNCFLQSCNGKCYCVPLSSGCPGTCPSNCSSTTWGERSTGYEVRCNERYLCEYRCADGYYGSSSNGISGCTKCPVAIGGSTSVAGSNTSITDCYIPSGTSFSDSTGSGTYTSNCNYSN